MSKKGNGHGGGGSKPSGAHMHPAAAKDDSFLERAKDFYFREYRKLLVIPFGLFILAAIIIGVYYVRTGDFFPKDVTLSGGISITVNTDKAIDMTQLEILLKQRFPASSVSTRVLQTSGKTTGIIVESSNPADEADIIGLMKEQVGALTEQDYSVENMGSSLGKSFFREMFVSLIFAFLLMGCVFFIYFRAFIPTLAALISAFFDIFIALGVIVFLGIRITSGGIAAFLMLISYSIDTSILLTTKVQKSSKENLKYAIFDAMKTGLTMSGAGLLATFISFLLTNNSTLKQIMLILVIGLLVDIITTWIENVGLLRIYIERKEKNGKAQ